MATKKKSEKSAEKPVPVKKPSKKEQILTLHASGMGDASDIALLTGSRASYVSSVLETAGKDTSYFDLYTSTTKPMNVYSKFFAGKLGFKDEETARSSVELIDRLYHQFDVAGDRAGQHHALVMALTMYNRARWTGKGAEAEIYRAWLADQLGAPAPKAVTGTRGSRKKR